MDAKWDIIMITSNNSKWRKNIAEGKHRVIRKILDTVIISGIYFY